MKTYTINLHDLDLGGGWKLVLLEDGVEVSTCVFPAGVTGYCKALDGGEAWAPVA